MGSSTAGWEEETREYREQGEGKTRRKKNNTQKICAHTDTHTYAHAWTNPLIWELSQISEPIKKNNAALCNEK